MSFTVGLAAFVIWSQEISRSAGTLNVSLDHVAEVFAAAVVILTEFRNHCKDKRNSVKTREGCCEYSAGCSTLSPDKNLICTDFTVEALVPVLAVAGVATDTVFAKSLMSTGLRNACVAIWRTNRAEKSVDEMELYWRYSKNTQIWWKSVQ